MSLKVNGEVIISDIASINWDKISNTPIPVYFIDEIQIPNTINTSASDVPHKETNGSSWTGMSGSHTNTTVANEVIGSDVRLTTRSTTFNHSYLCNCACK